MKCYFCGTEVLAEAFCEGCKQHVCVDCDQEAPWGQHDPDEHLDLDNDGYDE